MENTHQQPSRLIPFISIVIIMGLIGLITSIYQQFQIPIKEAFLAQSGNLKNTLATVLSFSFFLAYFTMGPLSAKTLNRRGYKNTLIIGIFILAVSLICLAGIMKQFEYHPFYLQITNDVTIPLSYFLFVLTSFVSGTGLTFIQTVANPYLVACHVNGTSPVQRQNIGGSVNSIATTLTPILVAAIVFGGANSESVNIGAVFLPIVILTVFVCALANIIRRMNLPNIENTSADNSTLTLSPWKIKHLALGVVALFFYVGVEVCVGSNINHYATQDLHFSPELAAKFASLYWLGLLIGRMTSSLFSKVSARTLLTASSSIAIVLLLVVIIWSNIYTLVAVGLCHSIMWPAIFSLSIDKLGKYTAKGSGILLMGVVGGGILPLMQGILADKLGAWDLTWTLVILGEAFILFYALVGSRINEEKLKPYLE